MNNPMKIFVIFGYKHVGKPISLTKDHIPFLRVHFDKPNLSGSRFNVIQAVAKSLEEITMMFIAPKIHELWDKLLSDNESLSTPEMELIYTQLKNLHFLKILVLILENQTQETFQNFH